MRQPLALAAVLWLCAAGGACAGSDDEPASSTGGAAGLGGAAASAGAPTGTGGGGTGAAGAGSAAGGAGGAGAPGGSGGAGAGAGAAGGGSAAGGAGGAAGSQMITVTITVHNTCDVSTTPASISVSAGTEFTVRWVNSAASASAADVAKVDPYNTVPIVLGLEPGESYHDSIREWCGIFTGTFAFRITGCYEPYYLDVDCDG